MKKRLIAAAVSLTLLAILFMKLDMAEIAARLRDVDGYWFALALFFFIPQTAAISWRWRMIARPLAPIAFEESARQVLASNTLNLVLPSKLGDLAKGVFLFRSGRCKLDDGIQVVVFEKLLDMGALSFWMLAGWLLFPSFAWWVIGCLALGGMIIVMLVGMYFTGGLERLAGYVPIRKLRHIMEGAPRVIRLTRADGSRRRTIIGWSLLIWLLHLLQVYCFFQCVGSAATFLEVLARMPIAIFAGLLPLTIAGFGTRDWAIVTIFGQASTPETMGAAALLVSLRYVVPALCGMPFMGRYIVKERGALEKKRATGAA